MIFMVIFCSASAAGLRQAPSGALGAISGVVVDAGSGRPLADAIVSLEIHGSARPGPQMLREVTSQFTDARGRFVFPDLATDASYVLRAKRPGYEDGAYGGIAYRPDTAALIELRAGQWFDHATIHLPKLGAVSGTVTDERGEPVVGAFVKVLTPIRVAGHRYLAGGPVAVTDDRGHYRAAGLPPGQYIAMVAALQTAAGAAANPGPLRGARADTVYPITFSSPLSAIDSARALETGQELTGLDVQLVPSAAFTVSGAVHGRPEHYQLTSLRLVARGLEDLGLGSEAAIVPVAADGSFVFQNVPEGDYLIEFAGSVTEFAVGSGSSRLFYGPQLPRLGGASINTRPATSAPPQTRVVVAAARSADHFARIPVSVSGRHLTGVAVPLQPTLSLALDFQRDTESSAPVEGSSSFSVYLEPAAGEPHLGHPRSSSSIDRAVPVIRGILPGRYVFRSNTPGWQIKSIVANGRDIAQDVLDASGGLPFSRVSVIFTSAVTTFTGSVRDSSGAPERAAVLVFPAERDRWVDYGLSPDRIAIVLSSSAGAYRVTTLPAGRYLAAAIPVTAFESWRDPDFLARLSARATAVTLHWGETTTQSLTVVDAR